MAKGRKRKSRKTVKPQVKVKRPTATVTRKRQPKAKKERSSRGRPGLVGGFQGHDPRSSYLPAKKSHILDNTIPRVEYQVDKNGFIQQVSRGPTKIQSASQPAWEEVKWEVGVPTMQTEFNGWQNEPVVTGYFMDTGAGVQSPAHPGFTAVAQRISRTEHVPLNQANAILAATSRHASASAKLVNPRLSRV